LGTDEGAAPAATGTTAVVDAPPCLAVRGLGVTFGGVHAVHDLTFEVGERELVGLIGPNGAGKTTTIDAITGFVRHRGRVAVQGVDVSDEPPHRRVEAGLGRTWQSLELFDDLSVRENLQVAAGRTTVGSSLADLVRPSRHGTDDAVTDALDLLGLGDVAGRRPNELPLGVQKLVAVARALAARPSVVLLDEPAAGLDTAESRALGEVLRRVVAGGTSILLVDHDMALVLDVCDRLAVLDVGQLLALGPPREIRNDPAVVGAYLGHR
jgi:branched-chain amino acid transport system ATP-binding protein